MIICHQTLVEYNTCTISYSYGHIGRHFVSNTKHQKTYSAVSSVLVSFYFFPPHNCLQLFFSSTCLSQEVIWKQLHLKSKILYLKYRYPLSKVWKVFLFEHSFSNDHCPSVAKLLSLLGSYWLFLITENNRSLVLISLEDYISVSDFTNKPSPSQGLQIYIVTREGNFPGNNRIK